MPFDIQAPMLTSNLSLHNKSLHSRNKVTLFEHLRGDARLVLRYAVTTTYVNRERSIQNIFSVRLKKRATQRNYLITTLGKSLYIAQYLIDYIPLNGLHTSERIRPHIRTYNGCPWKPAERNQIRTSKQLQLAASTETFHGNQAIA